MIVISEATQKTKDNVTKKIMLNSVGMIVTGHKTNRTRL